MPIKGTFPIVNDEEGRLCIAFDEKILMALDLVPGDTIEWFYEDGNWYLRKKKEVSK